MGSTWGIVGNSWKTALKGLGVVGTLAVVQLLLGLIALPFANQLNQAQATTSPEALAPALVVMLFLAVVNFFILPLLQAGCLSYANASYAQGIPTSPLASFWQGAKRLYLKLLGFEAITVVLAFVFALLTAVLFAVAIAPAANSPALSVVLSIIVAVPTGIGLYALLILLAMSPVAIVVETVGVFKGMARGLKVGRAAIGKLILVSLSLLITLLPAIALLMLIGFLQGGQMPGLGMQLVSMVLQSLVNALSMVLFIAGYVQIYRHKTILASK